MENYPNTSNNEKAQDQPTNQPNIPEDQKGFDARFKEVIDQEYPPEHATNIAGDRITTRTVAEDGLMDYKMQTADIRDANGIATSTMTESTGDKKDVPVLLGSGPTEDLGPKQEQVHEAPVEDSEITTADEPRTEEESQDNL